MATTAGASTKDQLIEKKFSKRDPSLKDIMDVLLGMRSDGLHQTNRLDSLNLLFTELLKKYKVLDETIARQDRVIKGLESKLAHLSNDSLDSKNTGRLSSVIFTGINSRPNTKCIDVSGEIKAIMEILEITTFQIKNYELIPWGSSYSVKCSFSHPSTCGHILRNSYKLRKCATNKYNVRPDLCDEQRKIRDKLVALRTKIESSSKAKCSLKSWRYLAVVYQDGTLEYYEADSTNTEPIKIEADLIPVRLRINASTYDHSSLATKTFGSHLSASSVLSSITPCTTNKLKKNALSGDCTIDMNTSFISASL